MLVGDTGSESVTSSVSVISGAQNDAPVGIGEVRGRTEMIADRRTDRTSSLTTRVGDALLPWFSSPAPFLTAEENVLTGAVLLGFAFGWALLAVLSVRFTNQPQRWAVAPAAFMGVAGLASLSG